jgi:hypothetical protein
MNNKGTRKLAYVEVRVCMVSDRGDRCSFAINFDVVFNLMYFRFRQVKLTYGKGGRSANKFRKSQIFGLQ